MNTRNACKNKLGNILKIPTRKQYIWFNPTQKPTLKKPKELFFANARTKKQARKIRFEK